MTEQEQSDVYEGVLDFAEDEGWHAGNWRSREASNAARA
jgi:hypothetical protein